MLLFLEGRTFFREYMFTRFFLHSLSFSSFVTGYSIKSVSWSRLCSELMIWRFYIWVCALRFLFLGHYTSSTIRESEPEIKGKEGGGNISNYGKRRLIPVTLYDNYGRGVMTKDAQCARTRIWVIKPAYMRARAQERLVPPLHGRKHICIYS